MTWRSGMILCRSPVRLGPCQFRDTARLLLIDLPPSDDRRDEEEEFVATVKPKPKVKGTTTFMLQAGWEL